jgi:hypothetical protein
MDYLKFVLIQMTNAFEHLFHVGTYTVSDWDTDSCIDSTVRYMKHQVQSSQQNRVATSTILALHFCSTFLKQLRLLSTTVHRRVKKIHSVACGDPMCHDDTVGLRHLLAKLQTVP